MHVVELEAKLAADETGDLRDEWCAALAQERADARKQIDAGLPPGPFRVAQAYHDACAAAERVVAAYWRQEHPRGLRGLPTT